MISDLFLIHGQNGENINKKTILIVLTAFDNATFKNMLLNSHDCHEKLITQITETLYSKKAKCIITLESETLEVGYLT